MRDDYVRELDICAQVTMTSVGAQVYQLFIVTLLTFANYLVQNVYSELHKWSWPFLVKANKVHELGRALTIHGNLYTLANYLVQSVYS